MRPDDGRVVSNFITQALRDKPITMYGDGTQTRSFCYVDDQIRGQLALLDGDHTGPINIGNDQEYSMLELAEVVLEVTNSSSPVEFVPLPKDDPTRRRPDLTEATEKLSWKPTVPLAEGVARTAEYFERVLAGAP
jgi:nucleoside-diphosphate-sugar epimerase